jgi:hypothetical protein
MQAIQYYTFGVGIEGLQGILIKIFNVRGLTQTQPLAAFSFI